MINVENVDVWGFEHAIRGMRNPLNSWNKSDSFMCPDINGFNDCTSNTLKCPRKNEYDFEKPIFCIGKNDLDLMRRLYKAGPEHRKYLRQIFVSMDITAPLYFWKEADQYKVGTTTNSCSTMHKIAAKEFDINDFSHEHIEELNDLDYNTGYQEWINIIKCLNYMREKYLETKDKKYWWQMIQLLPSSYNQKRTITMNYENVVTIIKQRTGHKLDEWNNFIEILKELPYIEDIMEEK